MLGNREADSVGTVEQLPRLRGRGERCDILSAPFVIVSSFSRQLRGDLDRHPFL
jgi:hypothetical protein